MADIETGDRGSARRSYEGAIVLLPGLAAAALMFAAGIGLMLFLLITAPLAVLVGVRWQFFGQAIFLDGSAGGAAALKASRETVRGRWLSVLGTTLAIQGLAILPGPVVGLALLMAGGASVEFANGISSLLYMLTIPVSTIALTLLYRDLSRQEELAPA